MNPSTSIQANLQRLQCLIQDNKRPVHAFHLRRELREALAHVLAGEPDSLETLRALHSFCIEPQQAEDR